MNKNIFCLGLIFVFLFSIVSAVEITVKDEVKPGENFIIKISGNFRYAVTKDNIEFYRINMPTQSSMGFLDVKNIEGDYYVYVKETVPLEKSPGEYYIKLVDVEYWDGSKYIDEPIEKNFTILNESAPFSISPPLIISHEDYEVELKNLLANSIEIDLSAKTKTIEEMQEATEEEEESFLDALFGLFKGEENTQEENETQETPTDSSQIITLKSGEKKKITFSPPEKKGFQVLELVYDNYPYGVLVYNPKDKEIVEEETIIDEEENESTTENKTAENKTNETTQEIIEENINLQTCDELGGIICNSTSQCNGTTQNSRTAVCCMGNCIPKQKSSTGKIIGWIIILAIAAFLVWFFKNKYSKTGPKKINLLNIAKGKK